MSYRPDFIDNANGNSLVNALNGHFAAAAEKGDLIAEFCIATAYFRPQAFDALMDSLEQLPKIRLLLGAEPLPGGDDDMKLGEAEDPEEFAARKAEKAAQALLERLKRGRDKLPFTKADRQKIERFVAFLKKGKETGQIECRQVTKSFMHAKAYIFLGKDRIPKGFVAGSSNLTPSGIRTSAELNLGVYEGVLPPKVTDWFDAQWEAASELPLLEIYEILLQHQDPYWIFIKVLFELYAADVLSEDKANNGFKVLEFQRHGIWRAKKILKELKGVIIADSVGLGKTYTAGGIISEYNAERKPVLIICPAAVRDSNWEDFLHKNYLTAEVVSYEELGCKDSPLMVSTEEMAKLSGFGATGAAYFPFEGGVKNIAERGRRHRHLRYDIDEYALIVIDEAHNYRNPYTPTRAAVLRNLLWGARPKDLVMLTATPVNNSLWDFFNLLRFFVRQNSQFADRGIPDLQGAFTQAMARDVNSLHPDELYPIVDATTVKRTRSFIKKYYSGELVWDKFEKKEVPLRFPDPMALTIRYSFEQQLGDFFSRLEECLAPSTGEPLIKFSRYKSGDYRKQQEDGRSNFNRTTIVGLIRSGLLKRLESSAYAFHKTINRMVREHEVFLRYLGEGKVIPTAALREMSAVEDEMDRSDDVEAAAKAIVKKSGAENYKDYDPQLALDVAADLVHLKKLRDMVAKAAGAQTDDKLDRLVEALAEIAKQAEEDAGERAPLGDRRKVLVFSYFADTAEWIHRHLAKVIATDDRLAAYRETDKQLRSENNGIRLGWVSGGDESDLSSKKAAGGFAPYSTESGMTDVYDILVTTDVLAEGVNLQQARHIINYDLPWNPMRMVQRHGRIDRIGSKYAKVYMRSFFPDERLDAMLKLHERISDKIAMAAASIGVTAPIEGTNSSEREFTDDMAAVKRLEAQDAGLYEQGGTIESTQTAEQYRQELRIAQEAKWPSEQSLKDMPMKAGSVTRMGKVTGYFFLGRIKAIVDQKETQRLYLRFIRTDKDFKPVSVVDPAGASAPAIERREATCLRLIECKPEQQRLLDSETLAEENAFDVWNGIIQPDILSAWNFETDIENIQTKIALVNQTAKDFIQQNLRGPGVALKEAQVNQVIDILDTVWPKREEALLREWLRGNGEDFAGLSPQKHAEKMAMMILNIGLRPGVNRPPLPVAGPDDVELICWMGIVAAE